MRVVPGARPSPTSDVTRRKFLKLGATAAATGAALSQTMTTPATATTAADRMSSIRRGRTADGRRKLIEYGWDVPSPEFIRQNIRTMEERPFEGIIFNLKVPAEDTQTFDSYNPFDAHPLSREEAKIDVLRKIEWERFTDNFIILTAGVEPREAMDWFSDGDWRVIRRNLALYAEAVTAARAVGICFDPEDYGNGMWRYSAAAYGGKSFEQVNTQVRKRGAEFIDGLQRVRPDLKLLIFRFRRFLRNLTPERYGSTLQTSMYATFPAFVDGMLDAVGSHTKLIDGSEVDYYFDESTLWTHARSDQKAGWYGLSPENYGKFANIDTAASVYLNMLLGRQSCPFLAPNTFGYYNELTEDDFQRWCEHNIYHGLLSTDEYVWVYSEAMSWWGNKPIKSVNKEVFPGAEEAVVWASNQFRQGKALGWDMVRTSAQFGLSQNPLLAGPDRTVRPEIVSSPEIRLTASTNGSVIDNGSSISAGAAVILSVSVDAGSPVQRVEFYDNSERTDWTLWAPNFSAVRATPGAHTFVARAHLADGGHVTSNPVFAQVR